MRTFCAARQFVAWFPLVAALIVALPALAAAQEPVKSFDQLGAVLNVGNKVRVTDARTERSAAGHGTRWQVHHD